MESLALFILLTFVTGLMVAILAVGYCSIEEQRALDEASKMDKSLATGARFFVNPDSQAKTAPATAVDDLLVARIEEYLRKEQALAVQFVARPSVETLYQGPERPELVN